jgi:hypothetical protein
MRCWSARLRATLNAQFTRTSTWLPHRAPESQLPPDHGDGVSRGGEPLCSKIWLTRWLTIYPGDERAFKGLRRIHRCERRRPEDPPWEHSCADPPKRCRQDNLLQSADEIPDAVSRPEFFRGQGHHLDPSGSNCKIGIGPILSDIGRISSSHRSRERQDRVAAQARYVFRLLAFKGGAEENAITERWSSSMTWILGSSRTRRP